MRVDTILKISSFFALLQQDYVRSFVHLHPYLSRNPSLGSKSVAFHRYQDECSKRLIGTSSITLLKSSFDPFEVNANGDREEEDSENEESQLHGEDDDWRSFRARLVAMERDLSNGPPHDTKLAIGSKYDGISDLDGISETELSIPIKDPSDESWAYESGTSIETGSIILHHPPLSAIPNKEEYGFSLGRQYLHKSVILILDHESNENEEMVSKGVILNRPTNLTLYDDNTTRPSEWNIRFGGDEFGIHTMDPKFFCLHALKSSQTLEVSREVIKGIYFTSFSEAQYLVNSGFATSNDFWVFSGFVSWEPGELVQEIEDGIWHSISMDDKTLRKGLRILSAGQGIDFENSGVRTWSMLMGLIGQSDFAWRSSSYENNFHDLMLNQWAKRYLLFDDVPLFLKASEYENTEDDEEKPRITDTLAPGTLLRGAGNFLFSEQVFHKCLMLIIQDDVVSVGVLLNHPSTRKIGETFIDKSSFFPKEVDISWSLRFGGPFNCPVNMTMTDGFDHEPLFLLHMSPKLRENHVGEMVGENFPHGIFKCSMKEAVNAILKGLAKPHDFMAVDGFCMWEKKEQDGTTYGGIIEEVIANRFEIVPDSQTEAAWSALQTQRHLSIRSLDRNVNISRQAWLLCASKLDHDGIRSNDDEILCDNALKVWIMANLL